MENQSIIGQGWGRQKGEEALVSAQKTQRFDKWRTFKVQSLNHIFILTLLSLPQAGLTSCCGQCASSEARSTQTRVRKARSICRGTTHSNSKRVNKNDAKRAGSSRKPLPAQGLDASGEDLAQAGVPIPDLRVVPNKTVNMTSRQKDVWW